MEPHVLLASQDRLGLSSADQVSPPGESAADRFLHSNDPFSTGMVNAIHLLVFIDPQNLLNRIRQ